MSKAANQDKIFWNQINQCKHQNTHYFVPFTVNSDTKKALENMEDHAHAGLWNRLMNASLKNGFYLLSIVWAENKIKVMRTKYPRRVKDK